MDAPPIQYARTDDGVNIAYWTLGEGPPLIHLPLNLAASHIQRETAIDFYAAWYARLARDRTLVRFDTRGCGLSDHEVPGLDLNGLVKDVEAVVAALGAPRVALFGGLTAGAVAVAAAAAQPGQVTDLVLWCSMIGGDWGHSIPGRSMAALREIDPTFASEFFRRGGVGLGEDARELLRFVGEVTVPATQAALGAALEESFDVSDLASRVRAQTLVLWPSDALLAPLSLGRETVARIPGAELRVIRGDSHAPFLSQAPAIAEAIQEFLGGEDTSLPQGFRTLLFTDLESSTAMTEAVRDARAQEVVRGHNAAVRSALAAHGGEEVKHTGDGIMAAFGSAVAAVEAALEIQRELAGAEVRVRVGLNAGEPIHEEDDYFGSAVQLAARVCDRAEPGQVVVTQVVRDLVRGKGFRFEDLGSVTLKGFAEPERLFVVGEHR